MRIEIFLRFEPFKDERPTASTREESGDGYDLWMAYSLRDGTLKK